MKTFVIGILLLTTCMTNAAIRHFQSRNDFQSSRDGNIAARTYDFTNEITISLWLKAVTLPSSLGSGEEIISKGITVFPGQLQFELRSPTTDRLQFLYANPDNTYIIWETTSAVLQNSTPIHLVVVFNYGDGSSIKMYTNSIEVAGSWIAGTGNQAGRTNQWAFNIASDAAATPGYTFFDGWTSEVAIWNAILSSNDVSRLYRSGMKGMPRQIQFDKLRVYYPSDDTHIETQGETGTFPNRGNDHSFTTAYTRASRFDRLDSGGTFIGEKILSYQPNE